MIIISIIMIQFWGFLFRSLYHWNLLAYHEHLVASSIADILGEFFVVLFPHVHEYGRGKEDQFLFNSRWSKEVPSSSADWLWQWWVFAGYMSLALFYVFFLILFSLWCSKVLAIFRIVHLYFRPLFPSFCILRKKPPNVSDLIWLKKSFFFFK